jgi:hypothetical protein
MEIFSPSLDDFHGDFIDILWGWDDFDGDFTDNHGDINRNYVFM